jgi:hypothetical protein
MPSGMPKSKTVTGFSSLLKNSDSYQGSALALPQTLQNQYRLKPLQHSADLKMSFSANCLAAASVA